MLSSFFSSQTTFFIGCLVIFRLIKSTKSRQGNFHELILARANQGFKSEEFKIDLLDQV
jgi:hypothetical protein